MEWFVLYIFQYSSCSDYEVLHYAVDEHIGPHVMVLNP